MADVSEIFNILIDDVPHYLSCTQGNHFCNLLQCLNLVKDESEVPTIEFKFWYSVTEWIEIIRQGGTFTLLDDQGNTEVLDQAMFNVLLNCCRGKKKTPCSCH